MGYIRTSRNNRVWGAVERGVREGMTAEEIIANIGAIENFSKGHWRTLIRSLEKRRQGKHVGVQIPPKVRERIIELAKQHL